MAKKYNSEVLKGRPSEMADIESLVEEELSRNSGEGRDEDTIAPPGGIAIIKSHPGTPG